jgi:hypothetical protein
MSEVIGQQGPEVPAWRMMVDRHGGGITSERWVGLCCLHRRLDR